VFVFIIQFEDLPGNFDSLNVRGLRFNKIKISLQYNPSASVDDPYLFGPFIPDWIIRRELSVKDSRWNGRI
jgi:hypothetical protein